MKKLIVNLIIFTLFVGCAIAGYKVFGYFNDKYYAIGKLICLIAGFIPVSIAEAIRHKKVSSLILPVLCIAGVAVWFGYSMPEVTYQEAKKELSLKYDYVKTCDKVFEEDEINKEVIPEYYKGSYIFSVLEDGEYRYVMVNPKTGDSYLLDEKYNKTASLYFED